MKAQNSPPAPGAVQLVLHYTGADDDRGGVMSVVRALATAKRFECVLGVNPGFVQRRVPPIATLELPRLEGEVIGWRTVWRARVVAREVRAWLRADAARLFHGHSRAGLIVALWLARWGERRVIVSVHCYGRQRWFYRWAARRLPGRLYWLSPAMKRYYRVADETWAQCIPGCVPARAELPGQSRGRKNAQLRLGGVGALVRWKQWHLVVGALAALPRETRGQVKFLHVGAPGNDADSQRYAAELRALTQSHGLAGNIEWRGERPSADSLLAEIDCLVVASHHEPFSVAVLEALAAGVPVLAADSGGASDLLVSGETGWLFRSSDVADLARAMTRLVESDALGRARVAPDAVRQFTAPVVAARWQEVYSAL